MDRRGFLKVAVVSTLPLPLLRDAGATSQSFVISSMGDCWPVHDPVAWALENARQPILERAKECLLRLSPKDRTRVVRLVTRRCKLNVLVVESERVVVHGWGKNGFADVRSFFKQRELARPEVEVVLLDRKKETSLIRSGDDFLFGERLAQGWPIQTYLNRWAQRHQPHQDDWTGAANTCSGFGWEGIEPNLVPWAALKSAWRRMTPFPCPNCDQPTILVNFGLVQCGMCNRLARFKHVCRNCSRMFNDDSIRSFAVMQWIVTNLDGDVWPSTSIVWGKAIQWEPTTTSICEVGGWTEGMPTHDS